MSVFHWQHWGKHVLEDQLLQSPVAHILKENLPWWANSHESLTLPESLEVSLGLLLALNCIRGRHGHDSFERYKAREQELRGSSHHTTHSNIHEKAEFDMCISTSGNSLNSHQAPGTIPQACREERLLYSPPCSFSVLSPVFQPSLPTHLTL